MVARKRAKTTKRGSKTLKDGVKAAKENSAKMDIDDTSEPIQSDIKKQKDKLHKFVKKLKETRRRKRIKKVKLQLLGKKLKGEPCSEVPENEKNSSQNLSLKEINEKYPYGISLSGIPKTSKMNDLTEITNKYKDLGIKASAITRQNTRAGIYHVLNLFCDSEETMKKAILLEPPSFKGKTLKMSLNPERVIYISGIPLDKDEEAIVSDLKETLGPSIYYINVPTDTKNKKMLGYAVAHVVDKDTHQNLLNKHSLNLWDSVQHCCSQQEFFDRFVLRIYSDCLDYSEEVLNKLVEKIRKENGANVAVDNSRKMYCLDETAVESIMKNPVKVIENRKVMLSRVPFVNFYINNIKKGVQKSDLLKLLHGLTICNLVFTPRKFKASFSVPTSEIERCKDLHQKKLLGDNIIVSQDGTKKVKMPNIFAKRNAQRKKKFREVINESSLTPGKKLQYLAMLSQEAKRSKPGKKKKFSANVDKKANKLSKGKGIGKKQNVSNLDKEKSSANNEKTGERKPIGKAKKVQHGVKAKRQRRSKKSKV